MGKAFCAKAASVAFALGTIVAVSGCDTNYYGSSESKRTTTTTTTPAPPPPATSSTTTVTPGYDGSATTTERTYRRY